MRLVIEICVLAGILWSAQVGSSYAGSGPVSTGVVLGGGLCVGLVALVVRIWLRKRRRRQRLDTRGSALW